MAACRTGSCALGMGVRWRKVTHKRTPQAVKSRNTARLATVGQIAALGTASPLGFVGNRGAGRTTTAQTEPITAVR